MLLESHICYVNPSDMHDKATNGKSMNSCIYKKLIPRPFLGKGDEEGGKGGGGVDLLSNKSS